MKEKATKEVKKEASKPIPEKKKINPLDPFLTILDDQRRKMEVFKNKEGVWDIRTEDNANMTSGAKNFFDMLINQVARDFDRRVEQVMDARFVGTISIVGKEYAVKLIKGETIIDGMPAKEFFMELKRADMADFMASKLSFGNTKI